jgi:hypothetical protein
LRRGHSKFCKAIKGQSIETEPLRQVALKNGLDNE